MVNLLVLGGSGRTGQYGIKYALEKGFHVTALVRNASSLVPHANLEIVVGSVSKQEDVARAVAIAPVDGVAVFLNANRSSDLPWAKLIVPPRFITDAVKNVADELRKSPDGRRPRLVVMSAIGAGDSLGITPWYLRLLISHTNLGSTYEDHNVLDREIISMTGDSIEWTLVRAAMLSTSGRKEVKTFEGNKSGAGMFISRESCANWMIDIAAGNEGTKYSNRAVIVSN